MVSIVMIDILRPWEGLTKKQKDFIGQSFTNKRGGIITITGVMKDTTSVKNVNFSYECSICSLDSELFPVGSLFGSKTSILKGRFICGCGTPSYNSQQIDIMSTRLCERRNYIYHGSYRCNSNLYVDIECPLSGGRNQKVPWHRFISGADIRARADMYKSLIDEEKQVCNLKVKFPYYKDKHLKRLNLNKWELKCSVCAEDQLSKLLVDNGIFECSIVQLRAGVNICRCNRAHNKKEKTALIKDTLDTEGGRFLGWTGVYKGNNELFNFIDSQGHHNSISYGNFKLGKRCRKCANSFMSSLKKAPLSHWQSIVDNNKSFVEGTKVVKFLDDNKVLLYCPECAEDMFSRDGIGLCEFPVKTTQLNRGCKPCRCSNRLTPKQRTYKLEQDLLVNGFKFLSWVGGKYRNISSRFLFTCPKGTTLEASYEGFTWSGISCACCNKRRSGFDPTKPANLYIVRWYGFGKSYLKFGITNREVSSRIKEQKRRSKLDYDVLNVYNNEDGYKIQKVENRLKSEFICGICPKDWLSCGYTESIEDTPYNLSKLKTLITKDLS